MITQKSIEEVFQSAKVEEVVEDFVNLKRRGVNYLGLCPFHDEKTPSFTVSPAKNIYKCFGCGKGGGPVTFIKEHEGFGFQEAIRYLAKKYNIQLEEKEYTPEEKQFIEKRDSYFIVNEFARDFYQKNLLESDAGRSIGLTYFKQRGFRESTIKDFDLGYASKDRNALTQAAINAQYKLEHLQDLGLTNEQEKDFFWSRVMFTLHNLSGKVVGFAGRTMSTDKKVPKYVNSPESEIYNKRKFLYGLFQAKNGIRKEDECILVEGYTDVISLHQAGIKNVVASSGTSLTLDQVRLLKRYSNNMLIIYDGDAAGVNAAMRGLDIVNEQDMDVRLVLLPEGHDPDSFLQASGKDAFKAYLKEEAKDFVLFKAELLSKEAAGDPIRKVGVLKDIVHSIALVPDMLKRNVFIQHCAKIFDMREEVLTQEVNKAIKGLIKKKRVEAERDALQKSRRQTTENNQTTSLPTHSLPQKSEDYKEQDIIRVLLTYGDQMYNESRNVTVAQYLLLNIESIIEEFESPLYKRILLEAKSLTDRGDFDIQHFLQHPDSTIQDLAISTVSDPYIYAEWAEKGVLLQTQKPPEQNFIKDSYQAVLRLKLDKVKAMISSVKKEILNLKQKDDRSEDYLYAIRAMQHLLQERNSIAQELNTVVLG